MLKIYNVKFKNLKLNKFTVIHIDENLHLG